RERGDSYLRRSALREHDVAADIPLRAHEVADRTVGASERSVDRHLQVIGTNPESVKIPSYAARLQRAPHENRQRLATLETGAVLGEVVVFDRQRAGAVSNRPADARTAAAIASDRFVERTLRKLVRDHVLREHKRQHRT